MTHEPKFTFKSLKISANYMITLRYGLDYISLKHLLWFLGSETLLLVHKSSGLDIVCTIQHPNQCFYTKHLIYWPKTASALRAIYLYFTSLRWAGGLAGAIKNKPDCISFTTICFDFQALQVWLIRRKILSKCFKEM